MRTYFQSCKWYYSLDPLALRFIVSYDLLIDMIPKKHKTKQVYIIFLTFFRCLNKAKLLHIKVTLIGYFQFWNHG